MFSQARSGHYDEGTVVRLFAPPDRPAPPKPVRVVSDVTAREVGHASPERFRVPTHMTTTKPPSDRLRSVSARVRTVTFGEA